MEHPCILTVFFINEFFVLIEKRDQDLRMIHKLKDELFKSFTDTRNNKSTGIRVIKQTDIRTEVFDLSSPGSSQDNIFVHVT